MRLYNDEIVYLTIGDELIVTTPDHPFYSEEHGWLGAGELEIEIGEAIRTAHESLHGLFSSPHFLRALVVKIAFAFHSALFTKKDHLVHTTRRIHATLIKMSTNFSNIYQVDRTFKT